MHTKYLNIVAHCEGLLEQYGDNYRGVGWTKRQEDADVRYQTMLELIRADGPERVTLLDFGCGLSHFLEYLQRQGRTDVEYNGLDLSAKMLAISRSKFPEITYYNTDIIQSAFELPDFDYVVMNGVFTLRHNLTYDEMLAYFKAVVVRLFRKARIGIAFNTMSKLVEWERDDLFHLSFDELAEFLYRNVSRHFVIRHDYRLFEYTTYVYR
jgi:SAM-dependent methyltransferase